MLKSLRFSAFLALFVMLSMCRRALDTPHSKVQTASTPTPSSEKWDPHSELNCIRYDVTTSKWDEIQDLLKSN